MRDEGTETAKDDEHFCECCARRLHPRTMVWLELNCETGELAKAGSAPWSDGPQSQGSFPYGRACARRALKQSETLVSGERIQ